MAEPIRMYTPHADARDELRRKLESASVDHADAVLAAYDLLQRAQDHGVLDTLRGAIGAGDTIIGKISEYANTPEGVRLLRNLLAAVRLLGELDPALLHAAAKAMSQAKAEGAGATQPSLLESLRRLTGPDSRRALARVAKFTESFGHALSSGQEGSSSERPSRPGNGAAVPVFLATAVVTLGIFWLVRRNSSR